MFLVGGVRWTDRWLTAAHSLWCQCSSVLLWLLWSNFSHPGDLTDSPGKRDIIRDIRNWVRHYNLQYLYYYYRNPPVPCVYLDLYSTSWRQSLTSHTLHSTDTGTLKWGVIYVWCVSRACVQLHSSAAVMGASEEEFNAARERLGALKKDPGNEVKLNIYALFKQVSNDTHLLLRVWTNKAHWASGLNNDTEGKHEFIYFKYILLYVWIWYHDFI